MPFVDIPVAKLRAPHLGVTIDGTVGTGLLELKPTGVPLLRLAVHRIRLFAGEVFADVFG